MRGLALQRVSCLPPRSAIIPRITARRSSTKTTVRISTGVTSPVSPTAGAGPQPFHRKIDGP
ncbi:MAG: hypothetical protein QOD57_409 [Actinomycetota bacterium]|jgi:hypothetical protein|nr:hypothetical protein [Actinomycetota bacterium]